jgi:hypothetical protein
MRVELPTDGTGLVNAAQSGTWNVTVNTALPAGSNQIGTVNPATPATWGLSALQNVTAPTNDLLAGCQFNNTPTAITTGNVSPLQCSVGGALREMNGANWGAQTTWTTATAQNTNLVLTCGDSPQGIILDLNGSGTISTGVITFQYSADATDCTGSTGAWTNLPVSNFLNPYTLATQTNPLTLTAAQTQYLIVPNNVRAIRARLTTALTGSGAQVILTPTVGSQNPTISGILNPLTAGSAIIGKVGIDQTTPNTTNHVSQNPYPDGAVVYTASATGTTAATTATLAGASSVTTYLCGFSIRANATAAATGNATVTGIITGTLNFTQWTAPLASGLGVTEEIFSPCVPASTTNTSIAVVSAAPGSGGTVSVTAWGYKL